MPIFQQDLERIEAKSKPRNGIGPTIENGGRDAKSMGPPSDLLSHGLPLPNDNFLPRKLSEESLRTEFCEGPIPESPRPNTPEQDMSTTCSDRAEFIERLKKGESPTWISHRSDRSVRTHAPRGEMGFPDNESLTSHDQLDSIRDQPRVTPLRSPIASRTADSSAFLPPPNVMSEGREAEAQNDTSLQLGLSIERPRSALHSGDFTQDKSSRDDRPGNKEARRVTNRNHLDGSGQSWIATSPPRDFTTFSFERREPPVRPSITTSSLSSLSSSISSSFVYKPPTSPLVQSESNDDLELASPMDGIDISSSVPRNTRRHTLMSSHSGCYGFPASPLPSQPSSLRQERALPYQAHQPRRSLTSASNLSMMPSLPHVPAFLSSRRPSLSSEVSPIQHASMVGSYEESILRGRMSTTPSKPLEFLAQIGVLGLGKCKSSLRCPSHVTLPFPAVFYSYPNSTNGLFKIEDGPSPYVGQVDLENGLSNPDEEARSKRKKQSRASERRQTGDGSDGMDGIEHTAEISDHEAHKAQRHRRRSNTLRAPPGGSYRIPEKGQIQIIIKNPNKTAVKLFLIPYDLAGMEPGTKTFIRQRSYSTGPIIENLPKAKDGEQSDRPILRYLVHLHICCPARGRFYLYKSIRVVFANRVPDGKEKLRNEITLPEPRYTSYKPIRVMHPQISGGTGLGASLTAEKASRRRSAGFFGGSHNTLEARDRLTTPSLPQHSHSFDFAGDNKPVEPIPFKLFHSRPKDTTQARNHTDPADLQSPGSSQTSRPTTQDSSNISSVGGFDGQFDKYDKLSKGDFGYGGNVFSGHHTRSPSGVSESLLSQRLRTLGVQGAAPQEAPNTMDDS